MTSLLSGPRDPSALDHAVAQTLRIALDPADPGSAVIGWPGQPLRDAPRHGDLLLRHGLCGGSRMMRVEDPAMQQAAQFARRGILTEHGMPGRFIGVVDAPGGWPIGRRLLGPNGLVAPETYLVRFAEAGENVVPPQTARAMIRTGSRGPAVADAQAKMNRIDARRAATGASRIARCPLTVDAIFGQNTRAATVSFQRIAFPASPNEWDGIVGPRTWAMLDLYDRGDMPVIPPDIPPDIPPNIPPNIPPIIPIGFRVIDPTRWGPLLGGLPTAPLRTQNAVQALVDGPDTYARMLGDLRRANNDRSFIYLLGWDCYDNFPLDPAAALPCSTSLNQVLSDAVAAGAQVRAMVWRNITGRDKFRAVGEVAARINALAGARGNGACIVDSRTGGATPVSPAAIRTVLDAWTTAVAPLTALPGIGDPIRRLNTQIAGEIDAAMRSVLAAHHQKVLIVFDGERLVGYCGGLDFNPNRATVATNCIAGSTPQQITASDPQHDTHCRIVGPAAADLLKTFVDRWLDHPEHGAIDAVGAKGPLRGNPVSAVPSPPVPNPTSGPSGDAPFGGSTSVIIARTYNPGPGGTTIPRQRDVSTLLLRAIANAESFIYFEDQYLWDFDTPAGGVLAIATALNGALRRPNLRHITALIPGNAISAPAHFQRAWRQRFIDEVRRGHSDEVANRFRVFQLNRGSCTEDGCLGRHTYVHSKCWVFDDELAVIGSANCNRRGYQHDSELDAFIFDDAAPSNAGPVFTALAAREAFSGELSPSGLTFAQQFRLKLWREHLGVSVVDGFDNSAWPTGSSAVGSVVPHLPNRPQIINATVDRIAFPLVDGIAERVRPFADPTSP